MSVGVLARERATILKGLLYYHQYPNKTMFSDLHTSTVDVINH